MKRRLSYIFLWTLAALAACTKNVIDLTDPEPMVFSATASHSTKSIITTTNYPLDEPFVIEAVHERSGVYMDSQTVSYDFSSTLWKTQEDFLWPLEGHISFYAGSPIVPGLTLTPENGVVAEWSIPDTSATQTDLCYAEAHEDCAMHSAAVPIVFSHALSQICFKARTIKDYSYSRRADNLIQANIITVVLDSVKIGGIVSKGTFTQKPKSWKLDADATTEYLVYKNEDGLELKCDRYDAPIVSLLSNMLLLPQTLGAEACLEEWHHMVIRSSVTDVNTGEIVSDTTTTLPRSSKLALRKYCLIWEPDFKYTFHVAVGMEDTEIATAFTDWTETKEIIIGDEK